MFGGIGLPELLIILVIVLLVFGAGKLPDIGSGLGKAIKNFKKASDEEDAKEIVDDKVDNKINDEKDEKKDRIDDN